MRLTGPSSTVLLHLPQCDFDIYPLKSNPSTLKPKWRFLTQNRVDLNCEKLAVKRLSERSLFTFNQFILPHCDCSVFDVCECTFMLVFVCWFSCFLFPPLWLHFQSAPLWAVNECKAAGAPTVEPGNRLLGYMSWQIRSVHWKTHNSAGGG